MLTRAHTIDVIAHTGSGTRDDFAWIGCRRNATTGSWKWGDTDHECHYSGKTTFEYWLENEPNGVHLNENCVTYWNIKGIADGATLLKWNDLACTHPQSYICEAPYAPNWIAGPSAPAEQHAYVFIRMPTTWEAARETCKSLRAGSDLASLETAEEEDFVQKNVMQGSKYPTWIGCFADSQSNRQQFQWVSGSSCTRGDASHHSWASQNLP